MSVHTSNCEEEQRVLNTYHMQEGLWLPLDESERRRNEYRRDLWHHKKLCLILDLDHTLLHSIKRKDMTAEEKYLIKQTDSRRDIVSKGGSLFKTTMGYTKLRPFVRQFLEEASQMFKMYIYTMGHRSYALQMASLLDPQGNYFRDKIIYRHDGTQKHQKSLDVVFDPESLVLILDDREEIWCRKHEDNLILMAEYNFFALSNHKFPIGCKSLSEQKIDENESEGALASILKVLRKIHHTFFEESKENLDGRDVRQLLKTVRKDILKGCKIFFSGVFTANKLQPDHHQPLWKMAEKLGAICSTELDLSITHVVSSDAGTTAESHWALKNEKFLVRPLWITAGYLLWQKPCEEEFLTINQFNYEDHISCFPTEKKEKSHMDVEPKG